MSFSEDFYASWAQTARQSRAVLCAWPLLCAVSSLSCHGRVVTQPGSPHQDDQISLARKVASYFLKMYLSWWLANRCVKLWIWSPALSKAKHGGTHAYCHPSKLRQGDQTSKVIPCCKATELILAPQKRLGKCIFVLRTQLLLAPTPFIIFTESLTVSSSGTQESGTC